MTRAQAVDRRRVVFVSYDGVLAGPGRTQTVPYVRGLADRGHAMALVTYEDPQRLEDAERIAAVRAALGDLPWTVVPRRGRSLADLGAGLRALKHVLAKQQAELVHARGYVPGFLARLARVPFVFDMRGFWPDERVDGGLWSRRSFGYWLWKRIERMLLRRAGSVVTLTERARDEMHRLDMIPADTPIHVTPTCTDLQRFRPVKRAARPAAARTAARRFVMLGGTSTWYLLDPMLDLAARALARDPTAVLHVLTEDPPEPIRAGLASRGIEPERVLVRAIPAADVPAWISGAYAALILIRACWSKGASCPTKLGELLACEVPVLMNAGIGDVDRLLGGRRVGVTVTDLTEEAYDAALSGLDALWQDGASDLRRRCRALAEEQFALEGALDRYEAAYDDAVGRTSPAS